ncbi:MAG: carboxylating nicotinate-nucleotide diphosphorylase [Anaerolineae bacterium]|nr:carboxylating nicotinate-nucleotide diphosphorylase [Ardenticatenia bacterium]HQZ71925.1 carboxylating nicotinate-nucleotide diphosphorylase [Anaerolineae bacterium]
MVAVRSPATLAPLQPLLYEDLVRAALREDLGRAGDLTSDAIIPDDLRATARLVARQEGRIAGLDVFAAAFRLLDGRLDVRLRHRDGLDAAAGTVLAEVRGPARSMLSAERVALNFLGRMCGIAGAARDMAAAAAPFGARIVCTRKTTPLLRALEKYAVRAGGAQNHRFGLDDAILIKDNHRHVAGGVAPAVARARAYAGHLVRIEVEVETLAQVEEALALGVDVLLLDNMDLDTLRRAAALAKGRALTEASGGIRPDTVATVAATGVDLISAGWLTHSAPVLDVALDIAIDSPEAWV